MDQEQARKYFKKIKELPAAIGFYFGSKSITDFIGRLNNQYNIPPEYLAGLITEIVLNDFDFAGIEDRIRQDLSFSDGQSKQLFIDFLGVIFLPIDKFLNKINIKEYLFKYGGKPESYNQFVERFNEELEDEYFNQLGELIKIHQKIVNPKEEREAAIRIFQNNLVYVLQDKSTDASVNLSGGIIYLLNKTPDFKNEILKVLYDNQEKLTHKQFILEGRSHSPTIGNWLKDFIKENGSGMFNNIVLAKYISNSENCRKLDEEEKRLVYKLLRLYRNLKFFPESMSSDDPAEWEIIPVDRSGDEVVKKKIGVPKTPEEKKIDELAAEEKKYSEDDLQKLALEEEINKKKQIEDLRVKANQYPENSLERRAIEEEIKKLGN